jgi:hypothetical protein
LYSIAKKSTLNVNVAVKANLDEIKKYFPTIEESKLTAIQANLTAAYNSIKTSETKITANYSEWTISKPAQSALIAGDEKYAKLIKFMKEKNVRLITALMM